MQSVELKQIHPQKSKKLFKTSPQLNPSKFCNTLTKANKFIKLEGVNLRVTCARE
jgi:hypothetical protein